MRFRHPSVAACLSASLILLATIPAHAATKKPPPCPDGRYLVTTPLPGIGAPDRLTALVLARKRATLGEACGGARATITRTKRAVRLTANWKRCSGVPGKVQLTAVFDGCDRIVGRLRGKKAGLDAKLTARRSRCGDGVLDPDTGETCEVDADCRAGERCSTACSCEPGGGTTTTSTPTTTSSTTTTTCVVSGSFEGATAPDYLMFSGGETGEAAEACATGTCNLVTSIVRSGSRAFQIPLKSFARLHPKFSVETLYVRIYHRIDVVVPPTRAVFAPVIVTDVEPQGITAVDVVVQPDGATRYALRDRRGPGRPVLYETGGLASGVWRRVELLTTIGAGTGVAELRIDGVVHHTVTGMDFGSTLLDAVFLSNNPNQYAANEADENDCASPGADCAKGGNWTATFDDVALTVGRYPGAGRVIARQGRPGAPTDAEWTVVGAGSIAEAWSNTPVNNASRAETPTSATPAAQTMLVAPFSQGVDPICQGSTVKVCQTWLHVGQLAPIVDERVAIRRRLAGITRDTALAGLTPVAQLRSDGLDGAFWTATGPELDAAEIGAVWAGGPPGSGVRVNDAWLVCEHQ